MLPGLTGEVERDRLWNLCAFRGGDADLDLDLLLDDLELLEDAELDLELHTEQK